MNWFEELPADCPPEEAFPPEGVFYRLGSIPSDESDFWSHRRRFPHKIFQVGECVARSLSLFDDLEAVGQMKRLIPSLRSKLIFQVGLKEKDGLIQQTGNDPSHFSWWRSVEFDLNTIKILEK